ncbi:MAG: aminotransferase class IV [Myxococcales bacterium]|nr:aminotransferase class IV [Myxococcales bacterium]
MTAKAAEFRLYEALRWDPAHGYWLLAEHLHRLARSAAFFGLVIDLDRIATALLDYSDALTAATKVRLEVPTDGAPLIETAPLKPSVPVTLALAAMPVRRDDVFLRHKTSRRAVYNEARRARPWADDVILYNERGELTESTSSNLVLEIDGRELTPHDDAGLLPGTYREHLLARGVLHKARLTTADLPRATRLWTINSVRGRCLGTWVTMETTAGQ